MVIIFWDTLVFDRIFLSPQVIISNKHDIYELPHELPNDFLRLNTNLQKNCKYQENLKSS